MVTKQLRGTYFMKGNPAFSKLKLKWWAMRQAAEQEFMLVSLTLSGTFW